MELKRYLLRSLGHVKSIPHWSKGVKFLLTSFSLTFWSNAAKMSVMENENPLKRIRKKEGLTLAALAGRVNIHTQAVYLNECGVYATILPATARWLDRNGYHSRSLQDEYIEWQSAHRAESGKILKAAEFQLGEPSIKISPLSCLLDDLKLSRMKFAKMLAVHPALLYKLDRGETFGIGLQVKQAMLEAGFSPSLVEELDWRTAEFGYYRRERKQGTTAFRAAT